MSKSKAEVLNDFVRKVARRAFNARVAQLVAAGNYDTARTVADQADRIIPDIACEIAYSVYGRQELADIMAWKQRKVRD